MPAGLCWEPYERYGSVMSRKVSLLLAVALLALVVLGLLLPSLRGGGFTVSPTAITSVVIAAIIAGTVLGVSARKR